MISVLSVTDLCKRITSTFGTETMPFWDGAGHRTFLLLFRRDNFIFDDGFKLDILLSQMLNDFDVVPFGLQCSKNVGRDVVRAPFFVEGRLETPLSLRCIC